MLVTSLYWNQVSRKISSGKAILLPSCELYIGEKRPSSEVMGEVAIENDKAYLKIKDAKGIKRTCYKGQKRGRIPQNKSSRIKLVWLIWRKIVDNIIWEKLKKILSDKRCRKYLIIKGYQKKLRILLDAKQKAFEKIFNLLMLK